MRTLFTWRNRRVRLYDFYRPLDACCRACQVVGARWHNATPFRPTSGRQVPSTPEPRTTHHVPARPRVPQVLEACALEPGTDQRPTPWRSNPVHPLSLVGKAPNLAHGPIAARGCSWVADAAIRPCARPRIPHPIRFRCPAHPGSRDGRSRSEKAELGPATPSPATRANGRNR